MIHTDKNNKSNASGLAAGIAIGAALGAAAVALKDKKNQEKVKATVKKVKKWADKTTSHIADKSDEIMRRSEDIVDDARVDLEKAGKEIKEPKDE